MRISDWSSDVCSSDLVLADGSHGIPARTLLACVETAAGHQPGHGMGRDTCCGMPGGWSCGRSEKTRGSPGLQANQSEKSALNGSVPIGSRPEKAQATYWLRQRLLRSRTKPLGVRARVSDRWRDLSDRKSTRLNSSH